MSITYGLLGLLEGAPRHGYELKHRYDREFHLSRPIPFGQVYATLARLSRDGLVDVTGVESGSGPDRKLYVITAAGVTQLEMWLDEPRPPTPQTRSELFARVTLALLTGREADHILDTQRSVHLVRMRELTDRRRSEDAAGALACDYELFHLEADLRWIESAGQRLLDARRKG